MTNKKSHSQIVAKVSKTWWDQSDQKESLSVGDLRQLFTSINSRTGGNNGHNGEAERDTTRLPKE